MVEDVDPEMRGKVRLEVVNALVMTLFDLIEIPYPSINFIAFSKPTKSDKFRRWSLNWPTLNALSR